MEEAEIIISRRRRSRSLRHYLGSLFLKNSFIYSEKSISMISFSDSVEQLPSESQFLQRLPIISFFQRYLVMNFQRLSVIKFFNVSLIYSFKSF